MNSVTVHYHLSPTGQRAAALAGLRPSAHQTTRLEASPALVAVATPTPSGELVVTLPSVRWDAPLTTELAVVEALGKLRSAEQARARWIRDQGSERLRAMLDLGVDVEALYLDEKLALDRPGWEFAEVDERDARYPTEEALDLLRRAREVDHRARLVWDHAAQAFRAGGVEFEGRVVWMRERVIRKGAK